MLKSEAAKYLSGIESYGEKQASSPTNVHAITGEVVSDSEDGMVRVNLNAEVFAGDDEQSIEIPTIGGLQEGDTTTILLTGEDYKGMTPMSIGTTGGIDRVKAIADAAQDQADRARLAANEADANAAAAHQSAETAMAQAQSATDYAFKAQAGLGMVQDVVGTLGWISNHGEYVLTEDETPIEGKPYYAQSLAANGQHTYTIQTLNGNQNPKQMGLYELHIAQSITNYVATHLALLDDGLHVVPLEGGYYVVLGSNGMGVYNPNGVQVGWYGEYMNLGRNSDVHIETVGNRLSFFKAGSTYPRKGDGTVDTEQLIGNLYPGEVASISVDPSTGRSSLYVGAINVYSELSIGPWVAKVNNDKSLSVYWGLG